MTPTNSAEQPVVNYRPGDIEHAHFLLRGAGMLDQSLELAMRDSMNSGLPIKYDPKEDEFSPTRDYEYQDTYCSDVKETAGITELLSSIGQKDILSSCPYLPVSHLGSMMGDASYVLTKAAELQDPDFVKARLNRLSRGFEGPLLGIEREPVEFPDDVCVTAVIAEFPEFNGESYLQTPSLMVETAKYSDIKERHGTSYQPYRFFDEYCSGKTYIIGLYESGTTDDAFYLQRYVAEHMLDVTHYNEIDGDWILDLAYRFMEEL